MKIKSQKKGFRSTLFKDVLFGTGAEPRADRAHKKDGRQDPHAPHWRPGEFHPPAGARAPPGWARDAAPPPERGPEGGPKGGPAERGPGPRLFSPAKEVGWAGSADLQCMPPSAVIGRASQNKFLDN